MTIDLPVKILVAEKWRTPAEPHNLIETSIDVMGVMRRKKFKQTFFLL